MTVDEGQVRKHAEAHGQAVVAGDLGRAASDLTDEAKQVAPKVMKQLPRPASAADVQSVSQEGDDYVALIQYSGEDHSATVESRWSERDGRPMITDLKIV